jgi:hypothetical protein
MIALGIIDWGASYWLTFSLVTLLKIFSRDTHILESWEKDRGIWVWWGQETGAHRSWRMLVEAWNILLQHNHRAVPYQALSFLRTSEWVACRGGGRGRYLALLRVLIWLKLCPHFPGLDEIQSPLRLCDGESQLPIWSDLESPERWASSYLWVSPLIILMEVWRPAHLVALVMSFPGPTVPWDGSSDIGK